MDLVNATPLEAITFRQFRSDGGLDCIVSVAGLFHHEQGATARRAHVQPELPLEDVYEGDPHETALLRQSALTPAKPGADVTFLGASFAPDGRPARRWTASIAIGPDLRKELAISGPRRWMPVTRPRWAGFRAKAPRLELTGWTLSEPHEATEVRLGWDKAFGGPIAGTALDDAPPDVHPDNPLGPGLLAIEHGDPTTSVTAHQIDDPAHPVVDWRDHESAPQGFGPMPPWWRVRQRFTGTYDDAWKASRHPLLPLDFDPRFWQCAPPGLVAERPMRGDESYELVNLHPDMPRCEGRLPGISLAVRCDGAGPASDGVHLLDLDGVHFDFRDSADIVLTWRARFPLDDVERATLTLDRANAEARRASAAERADA